MTRPHHRRAATISAVAISVVLGGSIIGCGGRATTETEVRATSRRGTDPHVVTLSAEQIRHGAIRWTVVEPVAQASAVEVPGQLVPDDDRTARLGAPARGRVIKIHVNAGDRVSAGQILVTLQSQDATSARADYAKAAAELNSRKAAANYARAAHE